MNINSTLSHRGEEPENGILYIVGTPIGNLNDISMRALNILKKVSLVACEDTRQTRKLMNKFEIQNKLISFNKQNSKYKIPKIIDELNQGKSIALVSDAGMPSICDPGEDLIKQVRLQKKDVICIPGPCAAITALVSSGLPSSSFIFMGFLTKKKSYREKLLLKISKHQETTVLYESPLRLKKLLQELKEFCGGEKEIQVFRELTKKYEEQIGLNVDMVINSFEKKEIQGEITVVIKGVDKFKNPEIDKCSLKKDLKNLVKAGLSLSEASKYLAKKNNLKKNTVYALY